ncbi:hypothetical protein AAE478_008286 [Parahypoxylon ruwenzoriense]
MGLLSLTYRRPQYIDKEQSRRSKDSILGSESDVSLKSVGSGGSSGIPDALAFDRIINGGTCPPCTVRDFMNYLLYIEHAAENLQFFLWYRDYVKRFNEAASMSDKQLSREWTQAMEDEVAGKIKKDAVDGLKKEPRAAAGIFKGTDFEKGANVVEKKDPFSTPPSTPSAKSSLSFGAPSFLSSPRAPGHQSQAQDAFASAGVPQPFTIQPFRGEISRVIRTYIATSSPRQLNLSAREQKGVLHALAYTTHPSAFRPVIRSVEATLRRQAHPNFVRWSICNGNPARVRFAQGLGGCVIALATAGALALTLSSAGRGWRAFFALGWMTGIATLNAACKGMCVVLHGLHHRHVRPWELFDDNFNFAANNANTSDSKENVLEEGRRSQEFNFDVLRESSNSYGNEPWVVRYERRSTIRKIFDREVWIQEPALRRIQDVIVLQSLLVALLGAGVLTAVFVAVPAGKLF